MIGPVIMAGKSICERVPLDTNVISELTKIRPEAKVISWIQASSEELLYLSVLTIGEIRKGIDSLPRSNKRALLESWLANDLVLRFSGRILDVNLDIAERWADLSTSQNSWSAAGGRRWLNGGNSIASQPDSCYSEHKGCPGYRNQYIESLATIIFAERGP